MLDKHKQMMQKKYNDLIVGNGHASAIFAHKMTKQSKSCLVIDCHSHIAGKENLDPLHFVGRQATYKYCDRHQVAKKH